MFVVAVSQLKWEPGEVELVNQLGFDAERREPPFLVLCQTEELLSSCL